MNRYDAKKIAIVALMLISIILLVLDLCGVIDFHIPGWLIKHLGNILL